MTAKEIMSLQVISVQGDETIEKLCEVLSQHRISGVPVLNGNGEMIGIVTEADVLKRQSETRVLEIMTAEVVTVSESTPLEEVASILTTHKIKRVPVLKSGQLTGIVSRADIVRAVAMGEPIHLQTPLFDL
jgi:CBS domain-containing protein